MVIVKKVLVVSEYDVENPALRSGVPYYIARGLKEAGIDYEVLQVTDKRTLWQRLQSRVKQGLCRSGIWQGFYDAGYSMATAKSYQHWWRQIDFNAFEHILTISPRTVAFLPNGVHPILWIDNSHASFHLYPEMLGLSKRSLQEGFQVEQIAFNRAKKIVTASAWLQREINKQYPYTSAKTIMIPRGANLTVWPGQKEVENFISERINNSLLHLVHVVSGGWVNDRKGSRMVIEVFRLLKKQLPVQLTLIGNIPAPEMELLKREGITCSGKVNKESGEGFEILQAMMGTAHFLFVPSKADGFGIVYAEAAALGLPSLALSVMGVTEAVQHGITGWLLPPETSAQQWVDFILEKWKNRQEYLSICASARSWADQNFKWSTNLKRIFGQER